MKWTPRVLCLILFAANIPAAQATEQESARYLKLEEGSLRYQSFGNPDHPTIVLVHSFNGYLESWKPNVPALVDAGYQVVTYDLWGRGLSTHLDTDLTLQVFVDQLQQLLKALKIEKTHLMGASFGAVVATEYALQFPKQVGKLIQVGPAGWPKESDLNACLLHIPLLADAIFYFNGVNVLKKRVLEYFYRQPQQWALDYWQKYAEIPGFTRSSLSILRHSPVKDYSEGWKRLGQSGQESLFIWGRHDKSFPYENTKRLKQWVPQAKLHSIDQAAHWMNIENTDEVNQVVVNYLGG